MHGGEFGQHDPGATLVTFSVCCTRITVMATRVIITRHRPHSHALHRVIGTAPGAVHIVD
jgi:hypothetical protein